MELRRDNLARAAAVTAAERADRLGRVEREIRQTQAEALGRAGERLQALLDELAVLDRSLDALHASPPDPAETALAGRIRAETVARNRVRDEAARARQNLIIQREALGLARQTPVEQ